MSLLHGFGVKKYIKTIYNDTITYFFVFFFFLVKISQEAYINEFPLTADKYYEWSSVWVGYIWLMTTVLSVPASLSVAYMSRSLSDKTILLITSIFYFVTM